MNQIITTRFLSYADLEARYNKSRVTLWRWVKRGILPSPVQLGPNSIAFSLEEIQEHEARLERKRYTAEP